MNNPILLSEYMVKATIEYWTAVCYPTLYFARYL